jgi:peptide methionine sulfoxide reductase msrA/msrB
MNSAAMDFIPLEEMEQAGYGKWIDEVKPATDMASQ